MNLRFLAASLLLLVCGSTSLADGYVLGTDGYYWNAGVAYTRVLVSGSNYCGRNGCYYSTPSYYTYTAVPTPTVVTQTTTTTNNYPPANWRTEIIKAHEAKAEQQAYEAALQTLTPSYGLGGGYGSLQLSTQGVNGQTAYGFNSIASLYGDTSINQLFQQANRLADTQQKLSSEAVGQFNSLVDAHGDRLSRTATILAKGQVLAQVANSLEQASQSTLTVTPNQPQQLEAVPQPQQPQTAPPPLAKPLDSTAAWTASAQKCFACHAGAKKEGGFDVTAYPNMSQEQRLNIIGRLTSKDDKVRMPRQADGKPGARLGTAEIRAWLNVGGGT